jgi:hypothetical protein
MKQFNIEDIEKSVEALQEVIKEIQIELRKKPAYYAKLAGYSRQSIHWLIKQENISKTQQIKPERIIHLYKVIQADLKKEWENIII